MKNHMTRHVYDKTLKVGPRLSYHVIIIIITTTTRIKTTNTNNINNLLASQNLIAGHPILIGET